MKTREKFEKYKPKKFLGQNFLVDENISHKIINALDIQEGDTVVEIGPGYGALTKHISAIDGIRYAAVELDKSLAEKLEIEFSGKVKIFNEDFLKFNLHQLSSRKLKVIGNIPYNITSQILIKLFDEFEIISEAVIMLQKEAADRLLSPPGTKNYGIFSVYAQSYGKVTRVLNVPRTAFFPKPEVESAVVHIKLDKTLDFDNTLFRKIVRAAFNKRRKMLSNSLKEFLSERNIQPTILKTDFTRRPDSLTAKEFIDLTKEISES